MYRGGEVCLNARWADGWVGRFTCLDEEGEREDVAVGPAGRAEHNIPQLLFGAEFVESLVLEKEDEEVELGGERDRLRAQLVGDLVGGWVKGD